MVFGTQQRTREDFRVVEGKSYINYDSFYKEKRAKLKGEELKISGDIEAYDVQEKDGRFLLWVH